MRIACWILKATNTLSEYVMHIVFLLQQWLHEVASMFRYTYITWLIFLNLITKNLIKLGAQTVEHYNIKVFPLFASLK